MPLSCSSANRRSSYIQSCSSVRPAAWVASTVTRLTRSLGKPGHRPVTIRAPPTGVDGSTRSRASSRSHRTCIRCSTDATTSMSSARAPSTSIAPPVTAATTAQLPASM